MLITPELALNFLARTNYHPGQRPMSNDTIIDFVKLIRTGQLSPDPPIQFCLKRGGKLALCNGQHRVAAIAFSKAAELDVDIHSEESHGKTSG